VEPPSTNIYEPFSGHARDTTAVAAAFRVRLIYRTTPHRDQFTMFDGTFIAPKQADPNITHEHDTLSSTVMWETDFFITFFFVLFAPSLVYIDTLFS
jgi:hypothetical protein